MRSNSARRTAFYRAAASLLLVASAHGTVSFGAVLPSAGSRGAEAASIAAPFVRVEAAGASSDAGVQDAIRATVTFLDDRVYSGEISVNGDGKLCLESNRLGGLAIVDFRAVRSIEVLGLDGSTPQGDVDLAQIIRMQRLRGRWTGVDENSVTFDSRGFGEVTVPRASVGDIVPPPLSGEPAAAAEGDESGEAESGGTALEGGAWRDWLSEGAEASGLTIRLPKRGNQILRTGNLSGNKVSIHVEWMGYPEFKIQIGGVAEQPAQENAEANAGEVAVDPLDGAVIIQPWHTTLAMFRRTGDAIDSVTVAHELALDSHMILHFQVDENEVKLLSLELASGDRILVDETLALGTAPDRLLIEALGRPVTVLFADIRDPKNMLGPDGMLTITRPIRGSEVSAFDGDQRRLVLDDGPVSFDRSSGVAFMPREKRGRLSADTPAKGLGRIGLRSGEALEINQALFLNGVFVVQSPYLEGAVSFPLEDVAYVRAESKRAAEAPGASYKMSFDGKSPVVAGFHGVVSEGGKLKVLRSEPGFLTTVGAFVDGRLAITRSTRSLFHAGRRAYPHDVVLHDGQVFPADVQQIDEATLTLVTPFSDESVTVTHDLVKAVLFEPRRAEFLLSEILKPKKKVQNNQQRFIFHGNEAKPKLDPTVVTSKKLERALLVPRSQKSDPGQHLLVAKNGDLLRTNVIGRSESHLSIDGGSGDAMEIPISVLAMWVYVKGPEESDEDPREAKIKTRRADEDWEIDLGPRAILKGELVSGDADAITFRHELIGNFKIKADEFKNLSFGEGFSPRMKAVLDWHTAPMPEPNIGG